MAGVFVPWFEGLRSHALTDLFAGGKTDALLLVPILIGLAVFPGSVGISRGRTLAAIVLVVTIASALLAVVAGGMLGAEAIDEGWELRTLSGCWTLCVGLAGMIWGATSGWILWTIHHLTYEPDTYRFVKTPGGEPPRA
jgi:hypothetical protein